MAGDLQQEIDKQMNDPMLPMGVITLSNMQGSVDLKQGMRHVFLNCQNVTINSAEGTNQADFINAQQVTVTDFKSGVLRFEKSKQIQNLKASSAKLDTDSSQIQQLNLEDSSANLFNCMLQTATFKNSNLHSFNDQYQGALSLDGGTYYIDTGTMSSTVDMKNGATINGPTLKAQGDITLDGSALNLDQPQFQKLTATSSHMLMSTAKFQGAVSITKDGTCVLKDPTFSSTADLEDGTFVITGGTFNGSITLNNASFTGKNLTCTGDITAMADDAGSMVLVDGSFQGLTATKMAMRISGKAKFTGNVTSKDGALDSDGATYQQLTITGGNFVSSGDQIQTLTGTELVGPSTLRSCKQAQTISLEGDGTGTLLIDDLTSCQSLTIKSYSYVRLVGAKPSTLDIEECGTVQLDGCQINQGTAKTIGLFLSDGTSTITQIDMEDVQSANTNKASKITAKNCTITDNGSTFTSADTCILITTGSTIQDHTNCNIVNMGGTITGDGPSVINTMGGDITNTKGYTGGMNFDVSQQGASVLYDGTDMTVQCTTGKVSVISTTSDVDITGNDNVNVIATLAEVSVEAGMNVHIQDGYTP
jgi:hypothetical protein